MKAQRARLYTRQLYGIERILTKACRAELAGLLTDIPIAELRRIASRLGGKRVLAVVKAGRGVEVGQSLVSFAIGRKIVLVRHQRNIFVLIHELAHALGSQREYDHGPAFRRRYVQLLVDLHLPRLAVDAAMKSTMQRQSSELRRLRSGCIALLLILAAMSAKYWGVV